MLLKNFYDRFTRNVADPDMRAKVLALMGGKLIGLVFLLTAMRVYLGPVLYAQAPGGPTPEINAINTVWTLIAAFLVFGMQVGFVMLEAGFARSRESVNILVEGIVDTCICGVTFWAWGFAFMFEPGNGFIGTTGFFSQGPGRHLRHDRRAAARVLGLPVRLRRHLLDDHVGRDGRPLRLRRRHSLQHRRHRLHLPDHRPLGLGAGRLARDDGRTAFRDFAGSTVVHSIGGAISLVGAIALGPRLGRVFRRDGGGPPLPHNIILGAVGGLILWFGWYGFNPGSTLSALDAQGIGRVSFNTTLAACSAGLAALFYAYARVGKWDLGLTTNGFLAGLVAITCPCYWVSPTGAFFIGLVAGFAVIWATDALEYLRIDDPIGAVPVHLVCGIWGTLSLGLFATGATGCRRPPASTRARS